MARNIDLEELQSVSPITDTLIDAMEQQESGGDPFSISPAGAEGPMQFTPDTAKRFGVKDVYNRAEAKAGAKRAMEYYYNKYKSVDKALAAYNAGEGAVDRGEYVKFKETQDYIPKVKKRLAKLTGEKDLEELEAVSTPSLSQVALGVGKRKGQAVGEFGERMKGKGGGEPMLPYIIDQFKLGLEVYRPDNQLDFQNNRIIELEQQGKISHLQAQKMIAANKRFYQPEIGRPEGIKVPKTSTGKDSMAAEYAGALARYAGTSLIPSGMVVKAAAKPFAAALTELLMTGSAAISGVEGRKAGEQLAYRYGLTEEEGGAIGEFLASFTIPMLTKSMAVGTGKLVGKGVAKAKEVTGIPGLGRKGQTEAARLASQKEIRAGYEGYPQAPTNVAEAQRLRGLEPEFQPSVARATGSPAIIAMEEQAARENVVNLTKSATQRESLLGATEKYKGKAFPEPTRPFVKSIENRVAVTQQSLAKTQQQIDSNLAALSQRTSRFNQTEIGQTLRGLRSTLAKKEMEVVSGKYDLAYSVADRVNLKPDMAPVSRELQSFLGDRAKTWQEKPGLIGQVLREYQPVAQKLPPPKTVQDIQRQRQLVAEAEKAGSPVTFREYDSLYKRTNKELADAFQRGRNSGDWDEYNALKVLQGSLKQRLDQIEASPTLVGKAYKDANSFYRDIYAPRFKAGIGGEMVRMNQYGYMTPDHQIFSKLINNPEGMREAMGLYGQDARFLGTLKRGLYDDFSAAVMKNGVIDPIAAKRYLSSNKDTLRYVPEIERELRNNAVMAEKLLVRRQSVVAELKGMDKQVLSKLLQAENPSQFLATKMNDPRGLREIALTVQNNPQAAQSLAREMAGIILARPDSKEFLAANAPTLAPIFNSLGKDHWKNVQDIIKMEEIAERVRVPSYVGEQKAEDIGTTLFGTPMRGIVAAISPRTFATSVRDRTINLGMRFFLKIREEQLQQFREAALFNPDVTAVLAQIGKSGSTPKLENSLRNHLFSHGIKVIAVGEQNRKELEK